ncbi:MAG: aminotransferase class I/II-fold pyridoxal phosphate-dependent enzyme [Candidatus Marinimicrobia bacterium]|nr:cystathionine beta-lyase [Candidatus Neomarinimicrobiota bacterium]MAG21124.1 cystathionine beta-lyase [Candidatus Neomarinimicrobiota bacterium]MDP6457298.1 aminotransferase class I/II-fold pyridoxal phosphate-dependent enzyme [Candidatus Neomarinimicrobiota bacterium]MDP6592712.1 aminotransferase class I/II-fold pyridoxal phosphate-dependent enzyme [Candidatus Neomarinimicrobiota bacterium]MDP6835774.1 aminotransferase class I/II-fold pyridoxal phosphate-dependent enzyme [Candidatus Neomar
MTESYNSIETKLIHAGEPDPRIGGAVSMPVFQSAMFETAGEESYHDVRYIRLNNTPNHIALHAKLAALENAEDALVTSSGMSAITVTLLTFLSAGDHFLIQDTLYGGTHTFVNHDVGKWGVEFDFIDGADPDSWKDKLKPKTRLIYVETMSNPLLQIGDLEAVTAFSREHRIISVIDNTFASPVNFRPAEWGFDISCHSCTKYLNGHSDIVAGAIIASADLIEKITHKLNHLGGTLDPHACFLLHRGIKTLALRMKQHNESAQKIAQFLENHEKIEKVNYPGLASHPDHDRGKKLFDGFSGMLSFELKEGLDAAKRFLNKVTLPILAPSLGGVETLMTRPAVTSHAGMSPSEREAIGITDSLVRVSAGIESAKDLIGDFDQALTES